MQNIQLSLAANILTQAAFSHEASSTIFEKASRTAVIEKIEQKFGKKSFLAQPAFLAY